jgi:hypothetical protein
LTAGGSMMTTEPSPGIVVTYVRHEGTAETRKFEPLGHDHPCVGTNCFACDRDFIPGDVTTLVAIGPGDSPEQREKARDGGWYNAVALVVHWACATGKTDG